MVLKKDLVLPTTCAGVVGVISTLFCGLIPNFIFAPCCGCGSGISGCSTVGVMFVVALSFAEELNEIAITPGCRKKYGNHIGNITDGTDIYKEADGICYSMKKDFTQYIRRAYLVGIIVLGVFLICLALWCSLPESYPLRAAKKSKPSELKPLVSQQQIELSEIKF